MPTESWCIMRDADLVLEGGGVKGSGLVGAITALASDADPYSFHRVAGTSAGAIVASLLAAGMSAEAIKTTMDELDFAQFEDQSGLLAHVPVLGGALALLRHQGLYVGGFLHEWLHETLAQHHIETWVDLKEDDPASALPPAERYRLVVIISDVSRGLMLRLPWDYESLLGVDPDKQLVADAVRASASIPFFFRPWKFSTNAEVMGHDHIVCTDGGMLTNFPMALFDRRDGKPSRWPTLGIKLSGRPNIRSGDWKPDSTNVELAKSLLSTMMGAHDRAYVSDPQSSSRTIFVDTSAYRATDFHLLPADKDLLFQTGLDSGRKFLASWDWERWKRGLYSPA